MSVNAFLSDSMKIPPKSNIFLIMMAYLITGCVSSNQSLFLKDNKDALYPLFDEWNARADVLLLFMRRNQ